MGPFTRVMTTNSCKDSLKSIQVKSGSFVRSLLPASYRWAFQMRTMVGAVGEFSSSYWLDFQ